MDEVGPTNDMRTPPTTADNPATRRQEMDEQRAAFEESAMKFPNIHSIERRADGVYVMWGTEVAWQAWQAAMEHAKRTSGNRN